MINKNTIKFPTDNIERQDIRMMIKNKLNNTLKFSRNNIERHYDALGNLKGYTSYEYNDDDRLKLYTEFKCDANGNLIEQERYDADGHLKGYTNYEYNGDGRLKSYTKFECDGNLITKEYYYANGERLNKEYKEYYDTDGRLKFYFRYEYNGDGDLIAKDSYTGDGDLVNTTYYH
ncbi:MAG: hypothetical protein OXF30_00205 [Candidatus Saccharibacteria bacterium]|nr:hypothetical protein [Candidatus Saccharibacteria bacterium]